MCTFQAQIVCIAMVKELFRLNPDALSYQEEVVYITTIPPDMGAKGFRSKNKRLSTKWAIYKLAKAGENLAPMGAPCF